MNRLGFKPAHAPDVSPWGASQIPDIVTLEVDLNRRPLFDVMDSQRDIIRSQAQDLGLENVFVSQRFRMDSYTPFLQIGGKPFRKPDPKEGIQLLQWAKDLLETAESPS